MSETNGSNGAEGASVASNEASASSSPGSNPGAPAGATAQDTTRPPAADPEGYKSKLCPILSAPMMTPGEETLQVASCKGPLCMFSVPITEMTPNGPKVTDRQCAIALTPTAISMLTNTMVMLEQSRQPQPQRPLVQPGNFKIKR